ncbi:ABC transporter substrate-binding protein [Tessaracoccus palaemonis]|uniref:ABC transporter substrate-binding protein n=1 Tax=Tessaracoccus palaemonis TaxID=2829499 RepID=A0ABX8SM55_9ACTN|nr:ABC transporter substrate-binding protein [Tessaracoccus palaemonis]QXT64029.1 ABC transporter substrate-binding protein [Tessaracoccus palaemonis]
MNLRRRTLLGATAAVAAVGATTACSAKPGGSGGSAVTGDTIKVGANYELSGAVATYGQASVDGITMAIDEINAAGGVNGKKLEIISYDNKSDAAEATTLANKLFTQDNVLVGMGPATSGNFKAIIPVANKNRVPVVSGSATADDVTWDGSTVQEFAFRICFNDSFQGTIMAKFAAENLGASSAVIIKDNSNDYSKGLADAFTTEFENQGGTIVTSEAYVAGDTDFNTILTRIKGQSFDVIYLPGYYSEAGLIIKQARDLGITAPFLGGDGFDSPTLLELAGASALNDVYFTNHYSSIDEDPTVQDFIKAFKEAKGAEPSAFNALGYDVGKFVADAISRASELTGDAVQKAMAETKGFVGVTGTFDMDGHHNPVKTILVIGLKDGVQDSSEKVG